MYDTVGPAALLTLAIFGVVYGAYYLLSVRTCRALSPPAGSGLRTGLPLHLFRPVIR